MLNYNELLLGPLYVASASVSPTYYLYFPWLLVAYVLSRASEAGSPKNRLGSKAATRHGPGTFSLSTDGLIQVYTY